MGIRSESKEGWTLEAREALGWEYAGCVDYPQSTLRLMHRLGNIVLRLLEVVPVDTGETPTTCVMSKQKQSTPEEGNMPAKKKATTKRTGTKSTKKPNAPKVSRARKTATKKTATRKSTISEPG